LVGVFPVEHVEAQLAGLVPVVARGDEFEARVAIDEPADEPCARHPIDVDAGARHPGAPARLLLRRGGVLRLGQRRREPLGELREEPFQGLPGAAEEEVDGGHLRHPLLQARQLAFELDALSSVRSLLRGSLRASSRASFASSW